MVSTSCAYEKTWWEKIYVSYNYQVQWFLKNISARKNVP